MKRVVGYSVGIAGYAVLRIQVGGDFFSWRHFVMFSAVFLVAVSSSILDAARVGKWPWNIE